MQIYIFYSKALYFFYFFKRKRGMPTETDTPHWIG